MIKKTIYTLCLCSLVWLSPAGAIVIGNGNTLLTDCPAGYITVIEDYMTIANASCPAGQVSAGTAESCLLATPAGSCIMYAPANLTYKNSKGEYQFTQPCPYE